MADRHIAERFNDEPCDGAMEQLVLGFADGTVTDEARMEQAIRHITRCRRCRELFLEYDIMEEALEEAMQESRRSHIQVLKEIGVELVKGALKPLSRAFLAPPAPVPVLSPDGGADALDFTVPYESGDMPIRIIALDSYVQIEILSDSDDSSYYLMGSSEYRAQFPERGLVTFDRVSPGAYLISRDHKSFVKIQIEGHR